MSRTYRRPLPGYKGEEHKDSYFRFVHGLASVGVGRRHLKEQYSSCRRAEDKKIIAQELHNSYTYSVSI